MSFVKLANKENALVLTTPKRNELLKDGPPPPRQFRHQILGRGTYGTVFKAIYRERPVAVKIVRNQMQSQHQKQQIFSTLHNESHVLRLKHKNIVSLIKLESTSEFGLIIMEHPMGQCLQRVLDTLSLPLAHRVFITQDVLAALRYCHSHHLLHLDVKPPNILVALGTKSTDSGHSGRYKRSYICKLCDFGSSIRLGESCALESSAKGTLRYMSPEALRSAPLSCASDIYSLGITMWQLQARRLPYHTLDCNESIAYQVVKHDLRPDDHLTLEALQPVSGSVNAANHKSCHCTERGISVTSDSAAIIRSYINDINSIAGCYNKKVDKPARRNLNYDTKHCRLRETQNMPIGGSRKHRRLAHFFDNPVPAGVAACLEIAYTELYKGCWIGQPELRFNSLELEHRLELILAKCSLN